LDIMNPCWIYRGVDLTHGARLTASAGKLPFNFEIGADAQKIRVGDARTAEGELEGRIDGCEGQPAAIHPLAPLPDDALVARLPAVALPARDGRHDVCLRFARPRLDPMWRSIGWRFASEVRMASLTLLAPLDGWCMPLAQVPDPVFAEGMIGDGV